MLLGSDELDANDSAAELDSLEDGAAVLETSLLESIVD